MLAFAEKQISPQGLRKLSAELLKNCRPLTDEEIDLSGSEVNTPQHHRRHHYGNCHRYTHETLQQGPRLVFLNYRHIAFIQIAQR